MVDRSDKNFERFSAEITPRLPTVKPWCGGLAKYMPEVVDILDVSDSIRVGVVAVINAINCRLAYRLVAGSPSSNYSWTLLGMKPTLEILWIIL